MTETAEKCKICGDPKKKIAKYCLKCGMELGNRMRNRPRNDRARIVKQMTDVWEKPWKS